MNEGLAVAIATVEVVLGWLGTTAFMVAYHLKTPRWNKTPVGRTFMHRAASMWLLLTYALTSRLLDPVPEIQQTMALVVYFFIILMEWRLFLVLRFIQEGRITLEHPNYTPIRDVWARVKNKVKFPKKEKPRD